MCLVSWIMHYVIDMRAWQNHHLVSGVCIVMHRFYSGLASMYASVILPHLFTLRKLSFPNPGLPTALIPTLVHTQEGVVSKPGYNALIAACSRENPSKDDIIQLMDAGGDANTYPETEVLFVVSFIE